MILKLRLVEAPIAGSPGIVVMQGASLGMLP